ncbi:unnamed protein product [Amoebophrya sp. A25]|nr:unnamed protein product [Amoebophrya sp. A25]|eukprot:GSA25T00021616001.1
MVETCEPVTAADVVLDSASSEALSEKGFVTDASSAIHLGTNNNNNDHAQERNGPTKTFVWTTDAGILPLAVATEQASRPQAVGFDAVFGAPFESACASQADDVIWADDFFAGVSKPLGAPPEAHYLAEACLRSAAEIAKLHVSAALACGFNGAISTDLVLSPLHPAIAEGAVASVAFEQPGPQDGAAASSSGPHVYYAAPPLSSSWSTSITGFHFDARAFLRAHGEMLAFTEMMKALDQWILNENSTLLACGDADNTPTSPEDFLHRKFFLRPQPVPYFTGLYEGAGGLLSEFSRKELSANALVAEILNLLSRNLPRATEKDGDGDAASLGGDGAEQLQDTNDRSIKGASATIIDTERAAVVAALTNVPGAAALADVKEQIAKKQHEVVDARREVVEAEKALENCNPYEDDEIKLRRVVSWKKGAMDMLTQQVSELQEQEKVATEKVSAARRRLELQARNRTATSAPAPRKAFSLLSDFLLFHEPISEADKAAVLADASGDSQAPSRSASKDSSTIVPDSYLAKAVGDDVNAIGGGDSSSVDSLQDDHRRAKFVRQRAFVRQGVFNRVPFVVRLLPGGEALRDPKSFLDGIMNGAVVVPSSATYSRSMGGARQPSKRGPQSLPKHAVEISFSRKAPQRALLSACINQTTLAADAPEQGKVYKPLWSHCVAPTFLNDAALGGDGLEVEPVEHWLILRSSGGSLRFQVGLCENGMFYGVNCNAQSFLSYAHNPMEVSDLLLESEALQCLGLLPGCLQANLLMRELLQSSSSDETKRCDGSSFEPHGGPGREASSIAPSSSKRKNDDTGISPLPLLAMLQAALYYDVKMWPVSFSSRAWGGMASPVLLHCILKKLQLLSPEHSYEREHFQLLLETLRKVPNDSGSSLQTHVDLLKRMELSILHSTPKRMKQVTAEDLRYAIDTYETMDLCGATK